jgi:hypothetical protein
VGAGGQRRRPAKKPAKKPAKTFGGELDSGHVAREFAEELRGAVERLAGPGGTAEWCADVALAVRQFYPQAECWQCEYAAPSGPEPHTISRVDGYWFDVTADQFGGKRLHASLALDVNVYTGLARAPWPGGGRIDPEEDPRAAELVAEMARAGVRPLAPAGKSWRKAAAWDEDEHPRADDGKFGEGGAGKPSGEKPAGGKDPDAGVLYKPRPWPEADPSRAEARAAARARDYPLTGATEGMPSEEDGYEPYHLDATRLALAIAHANGASREEASVGRWTPAGASASWPSSRTGTACTCSAAAARR